MVKKLLNLRDVELSSEVKTFLKAKTQITARAYSSSLKRFLVFYKKPIPEFMKEVEAQRAKNRELSPEERKREFEETINEYIEWSKEVGYSNNAIRVALASLQNLFKYYEVPISYAFINLPPPTPKKSNGKHSWKIHEIKAFVDGGKTYRDKAIILTMFQSGMAVNEICNLDYGDVSRQLKSGELPLLMRVVRKKNSTSFRTLIGADAVKYLRLYLGTRHNLKDESPLFAKEGTEKRITSGAIQNRLRELADKVFGIKEGEMNPYRPHSLRSAFRSRLTGKTDGVLIKYWMGDNLGAKDGAYLNLPDEEHMASYSVIEYRLSIETISSEQTKSLAENQDVYLQRLVQVEQENQSLKRMVGELAQKLGEFDSLKNQLDELEDFLRIPNGPVVKGEVEALKKEIN